jgi:hypothetical protein
MQRLILLLMALAAMLLVATVVWAQSIPVPSNNLSGTITTTGAFQVVQAQTNNRIGCTVQNNAALSSDDLMQVFFDKTNSANCSAATSAASVQLQPGQAVSCAIAVGYVLKDQICVSGTAGDPFFANFQ